MRNRPTRPRPWLPTTIRSASSLAAASTIAGPGSPSQTRNDTVTPPARPRMTTAPGPPSRGSARRWSIRSSAAARGAPRGRVDDAHDEQVRPEVARQVDRLPGRPLRRGRQVRREQDSTHRAGGARTRRDTGLGEHDHRTRQSSAVEPAAAAAVTTDEAPGPRGRGSSRRVLDDECGDHAEHAVAALGVRQDVAVECPRTGLGAVDDDVPALARVDAEGVASERGAPELVAVARDDLHRHPVEMPRMHHHALVHEPDEDLVAELGDDRRGGREARGR